MVRRRPENIEANRKKAEQNARRQQELEKSGARAPRVNTLKGKTILQKIKSISTRNLTQKLGRQQKTLQKRAELQGKQAAAKEGPKTADQARRPDEITREDTTANTQESLAEIERRSDEAIEAEEKAQQEKTTEAGDKEQARQKEIQQQKLRELSILNLRKQVEAGYAKAKELFKKKGSPDLESKKTDLASSKDGETSQGARVADLQTQTARRGAELDAAVQSKTRVDQNLAAQENAATSAVGKRATEITNRNAADASASGHLNTANENGAKANAEPVPPAIDAAGIQRNAEGDKRTATNKQTDANTIQANIDGANEKNNLLKTTEEDAKVKAETLKRTAEAELAAKREQTADGAAQTARTANTDAQADLQTKRQVEQTAAETQSGTKGKRDAKEGDVDAAGQVRDKAQQDATTAKKDADDAAKATEDANTQKDASEQRLNDAETPRKPDEPDGKAAIDKKKKEADEAEQKLKDAEEAKRLTEQDLADKQKAKQDAEAAKRKADEDAQKKKEAEDQAKRDADEAEQARKKKEKEEQDAEEAARKKQKEEDALEARRRKRDRLLSAINNLLLLRALLKLDFNLAMTLFDSIRNFNIPDLPDFNMQAFIDKAIGKIVKGAVVAAATAAVLSLLMRRSPSKEIPNVLYLYLPADLTFLKGDFSNVESPREQKLSDEDQKAQGYPYRAELYCQLDGNGQCSRKSNYRGVVDIEDNRYCITYTQLTSDPTKQLSIVEGDCYDEDEETFLNRYGDQVKQSNDYWTFIEEYVADRTAIVEKLDAEELQTYTLYQQELADKERYEAIQRRKGIVSPVEDTNAQEEDEEDEPQEDADEQDPTEPATLEGGGKRRGKTRKLKYVPSKNIRDLKALIDKIKAGTTFLSQSYTLEEIRQDKYRFRRGSWKP
jgi:hypothetical protein